MFDWITAAVEAAGIIIFCVWVIVPIREFREIFRRLFGLGDSPASGDPSSETTRGPAEDQQM